jgi:hypothetical protein
MRNPKRRLAKQILSELVNNVIWLFACLVASVLVLSLIGVITVFALSGLGYDVVDRKQWVEMRARNSNLERELSKFNEIAYLYPACMEYCMKKGNKK